MSILLFASLLLADTAAFIPANFTVPRVHRTAEYQLVPLGPDVARQDYEAYMSSIEHLQKTFTGNTKWPNKDVTMADAVKDVEGEKARFDARRSFTYSVLTMDGMKELGCVYIRPSDREGYDAVVRVWVTKEKFDQGFEPLLIADVKKWLAADWPFQKVAWPRRDISAAEWDALPKKAR